MNERDKSDMAFTYRETKSGDVFILRGGRVVTTLRDDMALGFLADVAGASFEAEQQIMARITGNYKRGNERLAREHPRTQGGRKG